MYGNIAEGLDISKVENKILGAAGLAKRAGKLVSGAQLCEDTIRQGKAVLVLLCSDMSENSEKKLCNAMYTYGVPYIKLSSTKEELGRKIGKDSFAVVCAFTDKGFSEIVCRALGIPDGSELAK